MTDNPYEWRKPGEALWPEKFPIDKLKPRRANSRDWEALYQGNPRPKGGVIFSATDLAYWIPYRQRDQPTPVRVQGAEQTQPLIRFPHENDQIQFTMSGDLTFKNTDGTDFVALQVWLTHGRHEFLCDQILGRKSFGQTLTAIASLLQQWPRIGSIIIEDAANGPAVIDTLQNTITGAAVLPRSAAGGKLARAHAVAPRIEAGDVVLPHPSIKPWVGHLVRELTSFPRGKNDDQVDALTHYLAWRTEHKGGYDHLLAMSRM